MSKIRLLPMLLLSLLLISGAAITAAQNKVLIYGSSISATYAGSPETYTFAGSEGDLINLYVIGDEPLRPTLALAQSNGQPIAFSDRDALTSLPSDARITVVLPADDTYIVTLSNQDNTVTGAYTIALTAAEPFTATNLTGTIEVTIEPDGTEQYFSIAANADAAQQVRVRDLPEGSGFTAQVQSEDGEILAAVAGGLDAIVFTLPASDTGYILTVGAVDSQAGTVAEVALLDGDGGAAPVTTGDTDSPPDPVATEEAEANNTNACVITATGVNVRTGPGTNFDVIGVLNAGDSIIATGQNNGWYTGQFNGQQGWVAESVVTATGPCSDLPVVAVDAAPATDVPAATATDTSPTDTAPPTATTPGDQPTTQPPTDVPTTMPTAIPTTMPTSTPMPTATTPPTEAPTAVPFTVTSMNCRYVVNDGATVDYRVEGPPSTTFTIQVRFGSTVYSVDRTTNAQGFLSGNQQFRQAGNSNYVGYIVYNGVDVATDDC